MINPAWNTFDGLTDTLYILYQNSLNPQAKVCELRIRPANCWLPYPAIRN